MQKQLIISVLFLSQVLFAVEAVEVLDNPSPSSLKQSVHIAVKYNPRTISTDEFLESVRLYALDAKDALYPSASLGCGYNYSQSNSSYHDSSSRYHGGNFSCGIRARHTLYDGGSGKNSYLSAQASAEATKAAYNTTDSRIPNTRGGLALSTLSIFLELTGMKAYQSIYSYRLQFLEKLRKVGVTDNLESTILVTQQYHQRLASVLVSRTAVFTNIVKRPPAPVLDTLDETIASLKIPATAQDAIDIALTKGPEVIRRNLNVQMAEYSLKAIKASLGPQVSVYAGVSRSHGRDYLDSINNSSSTNRVIGIEFSIPLGNKGHYGVQAQEKNLQSKISERQAAIDDAKFSITTTYNSLESNRKYYLTLVENYERQLEKIKKIEGRIDAGDTFGMNVSDLIVGIDNLTTQAKEITDLQTTMIESLFGIQQTTGLLFSDFARLPN